MAEGVKRATLIIFLLSVFILLAVFIFMHTMDIWNTNKNASVVGKEKTIRCTGIFYQVKLDSLKYSNGILQFDIDNRAGDVFDTLIVYGDNQTVEYNFTSLDILPIQTIKIPIKIINSFSTAVKGCEETKKQFTV